MTRKRILLAVLAFVLLLAAGAGAAWWWNERQTKDIRGSSTQEFVTTDEPGTTTRTKREAVSIPWPQYGFDPARTRYAPDFHHQPPYGTRWSRPLQALIEFPPAVAYGRLYVANIHGKFVALDVKSGKIDWQRDFDTCTASSPAVRGRFVYQGLMNACSESHDNATGYLVALDALTGRIRWRFKAGSVESSPLVVGNRVYFGSFDNRIHALSAATGKQLWSFATDDNVKGALAYANGTVYGGSYDGKVYALDAESGKLRWSSAGQAGLRGAGNFYAGPAVAYGRVFVGNTDGKVYAFGAESGHLLWSHQTGKYVYSSAAVYRRTIYVGSYDRKVYALDAATGDVRWTFSANGAVSGSPTVISGIVYFSSLQGETYGLDAETGKVRWRFHRGRYTPVVADAKRLYVVALRRIYAMVDR